MPDADDPMAALALLPQNQICADCDATDPDWASINLGIFLCIDCAGIHRNLGVHISKVRSLDLDTECWDQEQVEFMRSIGNVKARQEFEHTTPIYYMRPSKKIKSSYVRENFIRAKYVRKEFKQQEDEADEEEASKHYLYQMPEASRQGYLFKQNVKEVWQKRFFVLHGALLYYFKAETDSYPRGSLDVTSLRVKMPMDTDPEHRWMFQLRVPGRNYPVAAEKQEEMFLWVHAIRRAQIYYTQVASKSERERAAAPAEKDVESTFADLQAQAPIRMGEMSKQGGKIRTWKKRYFVLTPDGLLSYFKQPQPAPTDTPEGALDLLTCDLQLRHLDKRKNLFLLVAPARMFFFQAPSESDLAGWVEAIANLMHKCAPKRTVNFTDEELHQKLIKAEEEEDDWF